MSYYNIDEEPALAGASVADGDLMAIGDTSADHTIKNITMKDMREVAHRGLTDATASTLTVTAASHAGNVVTLNRAAGIAVTLPVATGTGNRYRFIVGTTITSNTTTIKVADATDTMAGHAILLQDSADTSVAFEGSSTDDTITFNGTTTGGIVGAEVELIDIATNLWFVSVVSTATGTEATPFSATVS